MFVLTSSFLIEIIYNINGVANLFFDSLLLPFIIPHIFSIYINIPIVILIATFYIVFGIVMSLIFDFIHVWIDPRTKIGSNKYNSKI